MSSHLATSAQLLALCVAFWIAVLGFGRRAPTPAESARFVLGLALGAALAHLGWVLLYADRVWMHSWLWVDPARGFTVLWLPLGPLVTAPWRAGAAARTRYLAAAFASLPLALAAARVGCLFAGCCHGIPTQLPWGVALAGELAPRHPTPLYEIAGFLGLHFAARAAPDPRVAPLVLIGFGLLRLGVEPWRAQPPLGAPLVPAWLLAAAWVAVGRILLRVGGLGDARRDRHAGTPPFGR